MCVLKESENDAWTVDSFMHFFITEATHHGLRIFADLEELCILYIIKA